MINDELYKKDLKMIKNRYSKERTSSGMKIPQKELQKYNKVQ